MLLGGDVFLRGGVTVAQPRQPAAVLVLGIVAAFLIESEETGEEHNLAGRAQRVLAGAIRQLGGGPLQPRRGHLARQRPLPDQFVEPRMIARTRPVL